MFHWLCVSTLSSLSFLQCPFSCLMNKAKEMESATTKGARDEELEACPQNNGALPVQCANDAPTGKAPGTPEAPPGAPACFAWVVTFGKEAATVLPQTNDQAVERLRRMTSPVALDCEGIDLGQKVSTLCVVSLCSEGSTLILDALHWPPAVEEAFHQLAENPQITKVMFDCRCDAKDLRKQCNIQLRRILDLQLVHVLHERSHQDPSQHADGLKFGGLPHLILFAKDAASRHLVQSVFRLPGLSRSAEIHHAVSPAAYPLIASVLNEKGHFDHSAWATRPLTPEQLKYAATDVVVMALLSKAFADSGLMDSLYQAAIDASVRYAALDLPDECKGHLLPCDILDAPSAYECKRMCSKCGRWLTAKSFMLQAENSDTCVTCFGQDAEHSLRESRAQRKIAP